MTAVICAKNIVKRYGKTVAVDHMSFTIPEGRIVGLIGPNGSGKTTALKALLGLTSFEGELSVLGLDPRTQRDALMQQVCFVADVAVLPRWLKVGNAIDFLEGIHPKFSRARAMQFIAQTKLGAQMKVGEMSKGMVAQLHLALIMAIDAKLLVLDEPTLGLDIVYRKQFYQNLLGDYFDAQKTILITTHQVEEIESVLSDVMFIADGKITLNASMEALSQRFVEITVAPANADAARALAPMHERQHFGRTVMIFDGLSVDALARLEALGVETTQQRSPSLADIFLATLKKPI